MSDPLFTAGPHALDAVSSGADADARIEQLLLGGLDHYLAGRYEQAINVWTRVLFLDRGHARARAYIDRARSAIAERQRESDEMLQHGVAAFERGDDGEARRLLSNAIAAGAAPDEAIVLLNRLDRRELTQPAGAASDRDAGRDDAQAEIRRKGPIAVRVAVAAAAMLSVAAAGVLAAAVWDRFEPRISGRDGRSLAPPIAYDGTLPLPRRGETALARAQSLAAGGHLRDALGALELVRATDPQKAEADRLRAEIQRELLSPGTARRTP